MAISRKPAARSSHTQPAAVPAHAPISPARSAAFKILDRVATTSAHSDDLLHGPGMSALSQADRNLATTLVLGVLRWQIALDARMQPLLQRPDLALPTPVATALRMGAFQLQHLDRIPAHAALSESVELVRAAGHGHAAGMVNAVLRKLTRQPGVPRGRSLPAGVEPGVPGGRSLPAGVEPGVPGRRSLPVGAEPPPSQKLYETTTAFAQRLAHPEWLATRWVRAYGRADTLAVCAYHQHEPQQGTLFTEQISPQQIPPLPNIDDGSRLVAELAAAAHPAPARVWDCCAAPGGKTLILHHRLTAHRQASPDLLASDVNPRRLESLAARLQSAAPNVRTLQADATQLPASEGLFDLILCDVPCSGTGTLSRNPEIKHRLQPSDLARQATRQREILSASLTRLAPGGSLLYSTCSLEPEENEHVVTAVLASLPQTSGIATASLEPALNHLAATGVLTAAPTHLLRNGHLRTLPGANFNGDGFFAALFRRT